MRLLAIFPGFLIPFLAFAQTETASNSFAQSYLKLYPSLTYKYDTRTQTHNYSGNWELDGDGKKDSVYFVGTGGAHLYYFVRVVLSSDGQSREFRFLESDMPRYSNDTLNMPGNFSYQAIRKNGKGDLVIYLNQETRVSHATELKRHCITSDKVRISFRGEKIRIRDAAP